MARKFMTDLEKARALADECRHTQFCDARQSALSHALKAVDAEPSIVEQQRDELLEVLKICEHVLRDEGCTYTAGVAKDVIDKVDRRLIALEKIAEGGAA